MIGTLLLHTKAVIIFGFEAKQWDISAATKKTHNALIDICMIKSGTNINAYIGWESCAVFGILKSRATRSQPILRPIFRLDLACTYLDTICGAFFQCNMQQLACTCRRSSAQGQNSSFPKIIQASWSPQYAVKLTRLLKRIDHA
jgi:hypothetical protein